ncbi:hypothetical protein GCM10017577_60160 [Pseudonocardia halophobica]|uniref:Uncharacterized protein n=1 Tax=Pseudonocardia halophobica TaxID=29401 RepID=A0A9W6L716_9PSEU|nr:hypothetical protein GCM10017577_60160 [Pseudonocardia halophobica]
MRDRDDDEPRERDADDRERDDEDDRELRPDPAAARRPAPSAARPAVPRPAMSPTVAAETDETGDRRTPGPGSQTGRRGAPGCEENRPQPGYAVLSRVTR